MEDYPNQGGGLSPLGYAGTEARGVMVPTVKQRIAAAVQQAEARLAAVKRAKEILDKNPDLEELLDIMQRSHF